MRKSSVTTFVICGLILCLGVWGCESKPTYTVAVAVLPADAGTVSGGGSFASGYTATLTAAPAAGYEFSGWSGDASGTDNPLELAVNSDLAITAEFVRLFSVEAEVLPAGAGSVTGCAVVRTGRPVTLTALPADGYYFSGWSGSVAGTADPVTVTVNADLTVTAEFREGGRWTWMSGVAAINQEPVFGTLGVPNPVNHPGSRWGAATWTDPAGNAWLFGGLLYTPAGGGPVFVLYRSDLWRFDGACWTWVGGPQAANQPGVYGTPGIPNPANFPGGREFPGVWSDGAGNSYLFGGYGLAKYFENESWWDAWVYYNDLWKFDGTSWTWIAGPCVTAGNLPHHWSSKNYLGVYGTMGIPDPANRPGGREAPATWMDSSGRMWLYGGHGYAASTPSSCYLGLSDLWVFDGSAWAWMGGAKNGILPPVHGTLGVADAGNTPGNRAFMSAWSDSAGNGWLFGGEQYLPSAYWYGEPNTDLWRFDGQYWTWVAGPDTPDQFGHYGIRGVPDAANWPGARMKSVTWRDREGNLWLFGGHFYSPAPTSPLPPLDCYLSDLWRFDGICWTWMNGPDSWNQPAHWGTMGVTGPANRPWGRYGMAGWADSRDNLWFYGGSQAAWGLSMFSDLWRFTP